MGYEVLLFVPNIIGYLRLLLLAASWFCYYSHPQTSILLYIVSALADGLDGYAARKLNQTSAFGAFLDVVVDVLGRGMMWCRLYHFGYLVAALEWMCFVCTHTAGADWKNATQDPPWYVQQTMQNGYKSPMGIYVIAGLHGLPIWLYAHYHEILTDTLHVPSIVQYLGIGILAGGRAICMFVEMWFIWSHISYLLRSEKSPTNGRMESFLPQNID